MNWRALGGLAIFLIGAAELYVLSSHPVKPGQTPVYAMGACILWMAVGIFLMFRGMKKKAE